MTEWLHFHFSLSCIGEGNGNPLQCSCLENPRDGGAWWADVSGVAQSRTWLKRLGSSNIYLFNRYYQLSGASQVALVVKNLPASAQRFHPGVWKIPWRREWLLTPVFFAWRIPWTEKPGGLQSIGSQTVGHAWVINTWTSHSRAAQK